MSGLSHTTNQNRFLDSKLGRLSFPAVWPFKQKKTEQEQTAPQILTEGQSLPPSPRLVVIVPDANVDLISLPKHIWNLAAPDCRKVLLIIRPCQEEDEFHARVNLTTLAAIIRDPRVVVQTQLVLGQSLEQAACQYMQPDDVFVCFEDHQIHGFLKKRRLAEILAQRTQRPIYTLKGSVSEMVDPISARLIDFLLLALCLVSLIGFFALEVWIDRNSTGTVHIIMQILAMIAEVWVISAVARNTFRI